LGAFYGLFNKLCFVGVTVDEDRCTQCGLCLNACKVDIRHVGDAECIQCGECISTCPTQAIRWKGKKRTVPTKQKQRILGAVLAAVLLGAIALCWFTASDNSSAVLQPGQPVPGMELSVITAEGIQAKTIDPSATGKITLINFWGTWCGGCLEELPYFDRIAREYEGAVQVIAIHTDSLHGTAPGYIAENYPDSPILFAKDQPSGDWDVYYSLLGGMGAYPYTVVVDEQGIVLRCISATVHYEELKAIVQDALKH
jgi:thiol-disulfide isomerase/thioredoxin/NAD-dependent dihydropyrimidine dehydrogenase PreA subunit